MKALIFILCLFHTLSFGQAGTFIVEGKITGEKIPPKIYLIYNSGDRTVIDSVTITAPLFVFKGLVTESRHANLVFDHQGVSLNKIDPKSADMLNIYLEKGTLRVAALDSIAKASLSGSELNNDYQHFKELLNPVIKKFNAIMTEFYALPANQKNLPEVQANFKEKYNAIGTEQKQILTGYIKDNPNKIITLDALRALGGPEPDANAIQPLFDLLSEKVKNSSDGKAFESLLNKFKATAIGSIAPDFVQNDQQGKPVPLSSFRGKYVLIDFWASWCGPCRQENPNIVRVYNQFVDKNFTILGVSLDRPNARQAWLAAIEKDKLTWPQVSDLNYWHNAVAVQYGVKSIPQNFLLDPEGRIIARDLRGEELRTKLADILK